MSGTTKRVFVTETDAREDSLASERGATRASAKRLAKSPSVVWKDFMAVR